MTEGEPVIYQKKGLRLFGDSTFVGSLHHYSLHNGITGDHVDHQAPLVTREDGRDEIYAHNITQNQFDDLRRDYGRRVNIELVDLTSSQMSEIAERERQQHGNRVQFVDSNIQVRSQE